MAYIVMAYIVMADSRLQGHRPATLPQEHRWPYCAGGRIARGGHIASVAVLRRRPHRRGGPHCADGRIVCTPRRSQRVPARPQPRARHAVGDADQKGDLEPWRSDLHRRAHDLLELGGVERAALVLVVLREELLRRRADERRLQLRLDHLRDLPQI